MKKLTAFLLAACLVFSFAGSAFAEECAESATAEEITTQVESTEAEIIEEVTLPQETQTIAAETEITEAVTESAAETVTEPQETESSAAETIIETETETEIETEIETETEEESDEDGISLLSDFAGTVKLTGAVISGGNVVVSGSADTSGTIYFFHVKPYQDEKSDIKDCLISSLNVTAGKPFSFTTAYKGEYLYDKFVAGANNTGKCISNAVYITNPEALAGKSILHTASGKKGLVIHSSSTISEAVQLGVKYTTITAELTSFLKSDGSVNMSGINAYKNFAASMSGNGIVVYMILVLPTSAPQLLRHSGSTGGPYYAAWNTDKGGAEIYENLMKVLAENYSAYVSHWIIGNEVNDNIQWNYMGNATIDQHVAEYAKTFRICYNAIKSVNSSAKVYMPVDHRWKQNANTLLKYDTKDYIDKFDQYINQGGNIDWSLAFHAYSIPLSAPEVWDDGERVASYNNTLLAGGGEVSFSENTFAITMKNIDILTSYMASKVSKSPSGAVRNIALTEQGWTSFSERTNSDAAKEQATSIAYAYNKTVSNPYLECLIVSRQVDALEMGNSYYKFGITDSQRRAKYSFTAFGRLGTDSSLYTSYILPVISESSGSKVSNYINPVTVASDWRSSYNTSVSGNSVKLGNSATSDKVIDMKLNSYNASAVPYLCVTVNASSDGGEETYNAMLRVYSGEKIIECDAGTGETGVDQKFSFDLTGWSGLSSISGVELWITGLNSTGNMTVSPLYASAKPGEVCSIEDVAVTNVTPDGYTVTVKLSSSSGIYKITMPTWTSKNGQDDIKWYTPKLQGNTAVLNVKASDHNDEKGIYNTHVYLYLTENKFDMKGVTVKLPHNDGLNFEDGEWKYYINDTLQSEYTGLVLHNNGWFYVDKGYINWDYTGLVLHNNGWFYVRGGMIDWSYTGLVLHNNGWFYVRGGMIDWSYTGLVLHNNGWFYVRGGMLDWNYTGLVLHNNGWFYVRGGMIDWSYTGLAKYNEGWFYVEGGMINWNYSGRVAYNNGLFNVRNGIVVWN